jgi:hypothetical protein
LQLSIANDANIVLAEFVARVVCFFAAFGANMPVSDIVDRPFLDVMPVPAAREQEERENHSD